MELDRTRKWRFGAAKLALLIAAAGCQAAPVGPGMLHDGLFAVDMTPTTLTQPNVYDWTFHSVAGRNITLKRGDHARRELLAFPSATNWTGGLTTANLGCAATDTFPNGPASIYSTKITPAALANMTLILSKAGRLVRVHKTFVDTATSTLGLDLGRTFSRTFVTLNPNGTQAYVVSDDGYLFIVDTVTMTKVEEVYVGAPAYGVAPVFDPVNTTANGARAEIYVPKNDGNVRRYAWDGSSATPLTVVADYPIATTITTHPKGDATRKIKAPAIVYDRVIYVGDQEGRLNAYDVTTPANSVSYPLGAPVNTAPAIEIQDGTYSLTDPSGVAKTVALGKAVYAFVTSGFNCHWVDLHKQASTRSMPLYLDDNNTAKRYGYLHDYSYDNTSTSSVELSLSAKATIRTDSTANLAGYTTYKTDEYLAAAEIDANSGNDGNYSGGPVWCYMRWSTSTGTTNVVKNATIELAIQNGSNQDIKVQEFRACPSYLRTAGTTNYTTTLWDFSNITVDTRPLPPNTTNDSVYMGPFAKDTNNNIRPLPSTSLQFDISNVFLGAAAAHYSMIMLYNTGNTVLWPYGDRNKDNPINDPTDRTEGGFFQISGNANTAPTLTLGTSTGSFATPTIETPAVIDPFTKCAYVFFQNTMYQLDFTNTTTWFDDSAATKKTLFNNSYLGRATATQGGASYETKTKYTANYTAPVFNYDMTAAYVLDRTPDSNAAVATTTWDYSLSKYALPLSASADKLQTAAGTPPRFENVTDNSDAGTHYASAFMVIDPFTSASTGGNVLFGLGDRVYQYDR